MDCYLNEDIDYIAKSQMISWSMLDEKSILITGATGLIGSQIVFALDRYNQLYDGKIKIYALARNAEKAKKMFGNQSSYVQIVVGDVTEPINIAEKVDYIIHGASMTSSKEFVDYPVETILTGMTGTDNVLRFAKEKEVKSMVYLSSLEVYGVTDPNKKSVKEDEYGYIDQMIPRSSYSEGKRMAECLCISYGHEYGVPVKIARLSQTFGPGVAYSDNRVFAQFARCVIEKSDIVLKTKGETFRNYCYIRDAITGILCVLLKGSCNETYNIANKTTGISICDMAYLVADEIAEKNINVVFDVAEDLSKFGYGPTIKIALDTQKIEQLGWKAEVGIRDAFERMIGSMRSLKC